MLSFNIDEARRAIRALATEANPLAAWNGWPEFNRPLMLVGKAESIQLLLMLEPQERGELAADLCRGAIGETLDEADHDIASCIDWRDYYFQEDCNISILNGLEGPLYCAARANCYAAIALTYVFEARDKQAVSRAPSADSGLLLLRALEAAMLGDAALSWVDMLELEVGKLSFTEDAKLRKIKKDLRDSAWYREGYPARRRHDITQNRARWSSGALHAVVNEAVILRNARKAWASAGGHAKHARTNTLKEQAIKWLKNHHREHSSTAKVATAFIASVKKGHPPAQKTVEIWLGDFLKKNAEYKPRKRLQRSRK